MNSLKKILNYIIPGLILVVGLALPGYGVEVQPGEPAVFKVEINRSEPIVGVPFEAEIEVQDRQGNLVRDYNQRDREIILESLGTGELNPSKITSDQFKNGRAVVSLQYDVTEKTSIQVRELNHVAQGRSEQIQFSPGPPNQLVLETPERARVGSPFFMEVVVRDQFGNLVTDLGERSGKLQLSSSGTIQPAPSEVKLEKFENGSARIPVRYNAAENIDLRVSLPEYDGAEATNSLEVLPGKTQQLAISGPDEVTAGESFSLLVESLDEAGNVVTDFGEYTRTVEIRSQGSGNLLSGFLSSEIFSGGVASGQFSIEQAGTHHIRGRDSLTDSRSDTLTIRVFPAELSKIHADLKNSVVAGEQLEVSIQGVDQYGNSIRRLSEEHLPLEVRRGDETVRTLEQPAEFPVSFEIPVREAGFHNLVFARGEKKLGRSPRYHVEPAAPSQISAEVPEQVQAGEPFRVTLRLEDDYGNRIQNPPAGSSPKAVLQSQGEPDNHTVKPEQFHLGEATLMYSEEKAGEAFISLQHESFNIQSRTETFSIEPGKYHQMRISAPETASADEQFLVEVQFLDRYGNVMNTVPEDITQLKLSASGISSLEPAVVSRQKLTAPVTEIPASYNRAEKITIEARDNLGRRAGINQPIRIEAGELANVDVQVPANVRAGKSFPVRLVAQDEHGNKLSGEEVPSDASFEFQLESGSLQSGSIITGSQFKDGTASTKVSIRTAGEQRIVLRGYGLREVSRVIDVRAGTPEEFEISAEGPVRSGLPFPARIELMDSYGNTVESIPEEVSGVKLSAGEGGTVFPSVLDRELFSENGEARVQLIYEGLGTMNLSVEPLTKKREVPVISKFALERNLNNAKIHLVSSSPLEFGRSETDENHRLEIQAGPAKLKGSKFQERFDGWFLDYIVQEQMYENPLPVVSLVVQGSEAFTVKESTSQNVHTLQLEVESTNSGSFDRALDLMEQEKYQQALSELELYLEEFPNDEDAQQLHQRLTRLIEVTE